MEKRMTAIDTAIDPQGARVAFQTLKHQLDELDEYRRSNTDVDRAAIVAAAVGRMIQQPEVRARFAALPAEEFDIGHVDRLESAALATWHASLSLRRATVQSSGAQVPEDVSAEAVATKQRMMRVLAYHLGDNDEVVEQLADIRSGAGHLDLATDLMRLAELYEAHAETLAADTRHYRATDRDGARSLAMAIHQALGDGLDNERDEWAEYRARAWTFLVNTYEEVSALGRWIYRHDDAERLFPSLYTIGRQRRRGNGSDESPGDEISDELPDTEPDTETPAAAASA